MDFVIYPAQPIAVSFWDIAISFGLVAVLMGIYLLIAWSLGR